MAKKKALTAVSALPIVIQYYVKPKGLIMANCCQYCISIYLPVTAVILLRGKRPVADSAGASDTMK
ncbi:MAG TPA: hypothetical protein VI461_17790 [Chitinophagaceae bacterium]|nr:hypothetical protein [Chitinophagaceae bacterium]